MNKIILSLNNIKLIKPLPTALATIIALIGIVSPVKAQYKTSAEKLVTENIAIEPECKRWGIVKVNGKDTLVCVERNNGTKHSFDQNDNKIAQYTPPPKPSKPKSGNEEGASNSNNTTRSRKFAEELQEMNIGFNSDSNFTSFCAPKNSCPPKEQPKGNNLISSKPNNEFQKSGDIVRFKDSRNTKRKFSGKKK